MSRAELLRVINRGDVDVALANGWITRVRRGAYRLNVTMLKLRMHLIAARAPEAVIAKEREKLEGYAEAKAKLIEQQAVIAAL